MFTDWLRDVPVSSSLVRVEAGFASDSTLLMVSMPAAMIAYIPSDPAIIMIGVIRSQNLLTPPKQVGTQSTGGIERTTNAPPRPPTTS
jgi:hypothetical protein